MTDHTLTYDPSDFDAPTVLDLEQIATTPIHPAANDQQAALLRWANEHPIDRPTPPMSGGRYRLPHPDTGKPKGWTRMSTLAKTLDDTAGLERWRTRLLIAGLHANRHLLDDLDPTDRAAVDQAATAAALHGGDKLRADLGTAMHTALEHHVLATGHRPPAPYDRDLDAITEAITAAGLTFPPELVEATLVCPPLEAAGRTDLIAAGPWGEQLRIADLKTGSELRPISEAAQLAGYARSTHRWTPDGYQPTPDIDQAHGLLIHAPLGSGTCTIHLLDLTVGAEIADLCLAVRKRRNGANKLTTVFVEAPTLDVVAERADAVRGRIKTITDPTHKATLVRTWPDDCPHKPPWTWQQLDALEHALWAIDGIEAPFRLDPDEPPAEAPAAADPPPQVTTAPEWPTPDDGPIVADSTTAALQAASLMLGDDQRELARTWAWEAKTQHRPWGIVRPGEMTTRTHAINHAALACAVHLDDETTRLAISAVTGTELQPTWRTGAVLGSLTIAQAQDLRTYAERVGAGHGDTVADLGHRFATDCAATPAT